jgi:uncharacterized protein YbjQ (UPF0145 family)
MRFVCIASTIALAGCATAPVVLAHSEEAARVLVTTDPLCPASASACDILEVVDVHTEATSEDKGFDELRRRAALLRADAVIGAEFEHGDAGDPSHLSGMLVRYGAPVPPHEEIGRVDIPSAEDAEDKGLATLSARARAMGGDRVIDVTFEHGEGGAPGHLRGLVIRFRR